MADNHVIPSHHVEFCRALAAVAKTFGVSHFTAEFDPGWKDPWHDRIKLSWSAGRHEADVENLTITSDVTIRTTINVSDPGATP